MKKLFSNQDAERIEQLENQLAQLNSIIREKDREIGDLKTELDSQGKRLIDALHEKNHQATLAEVVQHDAINEQLHLAKTAIKKQSEAAAYWQGEAEKACRARDNAKAGFVRLKKKIARLETSSNHRARHG